MLLFSCNSNNNPQFRFLLRNDTIIVYKNSQTILSYSTQDRVLFDYTKQKDFTTLYNNFRTKYNISLVNDWPFLFKLIEADSIFLKCKSADIEFLNTTINNIYETIPKDSEILNLIEATQFRSLIPTTQYHRMREDDVKQKINFYSEFARSISEDIEAQKNIDSMSFKNFKNNIFLLNFQIAILEKILFKIRQTGIANSQIYFYEVTKSKLNGSDNLYFEISISRDNQGKLLIEKTLLNKEVYTLNRWFNSN